MNSHTFRTYKKESKKLSKLVIPKLGFSIILAQIILSAHALSLEQILKVSPVNISIPKSL